MYNFYILASKGKILAFQYKSTVFISENAERNPERFVKNLKIFAFLQFLIHHFALQRCCYMMVNS